MQTVQLAACWISTPHGPPVNDENEGEGVQAKHDALPELLALELPEGICSINVDLLLQEHENLLAVG